jgi:dihydroorotate dehydrogenase
MGWYASVGRRAFFALEPEHSHRVAQALLSLPLPWRRIGGVVDDPVLATSLAGVALRNPIGLAAGFDKTCTHLDALGKLGFGYVVGGTITRRPREGNPRPRIARDPVRRSMVNAMGLPNPSAASAAMNLAASRRTCPRFVSVADEALEDVMATLAAVEAVADGLELNASCPNVAWGRDTDDERHLRELVTAIRARTSKPLIVKLPPYVSDRECEAVRALATIAIDAGADGLTASNTRPVADPRLSTGTGGLSGRALWDRTVEIVGGMRATIGPDPALNACGGVFSAADVDECLRAGATTVQVYTGLIYEGPGLPGMLTHGLAARLRDRGRAPAGAVGSP